MGENQRVPSCHYEIDEAGRLWLVERTESNPDWEPGNKTGLDALRGALRMVECREPVFHTGEVRMNGGSGIEYVAWFVKGEMRDVVLEGDGDQ